ncbi:hypothetical protein JMN32_09995 [Fulvivirga sp. 29W222]|uniref:Uncharacterized protein n=1 Tax=Fulvivirga marina TaxID=2494733 RepID=A0A937KDW9_9BACT|nr:hypothetical protein [Fulvivirga marina]MBL6446643.1 hypothetical protein [Fulvivirga marina]
MKKIIVYWLPMPALGMINGIARGAIYGESLGEPLAHQVSALTLMLLLLIYGVIIRGKLNLSSILITLKHGAIWVLLTVLFEFILGLWVFQQPLEEVLYNYNIAEGQWWPFVLLFVFALPFLLKYGSKRRLSND